MQKTRELRNFIILIVIFALAGCRENPVPKPRGYFRIDLPEKAYRVYDTSCPFVFEYPVYATITTDKGKLTEPCWFNIDFPAFRARLHISYKPVRRNLEEIIKESYDYTYAHSVKADAITELPWQNRDRKVYGILYDIKGNTASSVQFFVTDSSKNFLRGALYFNAEPEADSLAPVIDFIRKDIVHMIESFSWK
jgi:gliding motility-associated lipoprotein GldD